MSYIWKDKKSGLYNVKFMFHNKCIVKRGLSSKNNAANYENVFLEKYGYNGYSPYTRQNRKRYYSQKKSLKYAHTFCDELSNSVHCNKAPNHNLLSNCNIKSINQHKEVRKRILVCRLRNENRNKRIDSK